MCPTQINCQRVHWYSRKGNTAGVLSVVVLVMVEAGQSFEMGFTHVFIKLVCFCLLIKEIIFVCPIPAWLTQVHLNSRGNALALTISLLQNAVCTICCNKPCDMQQAYICVAMAIGT